MKCSRRTCFHPGCVRPILVVGPLRAGCACRRRRRALRRRERRLGRRVARRRCSSASRSCARRSRAPSSSRSRCSSHGFKPAADLRRARSGVVTIYSYFGAKPGSATLEEGSGFVVDRTGIDPDGGARDRLERRLLAAAPLPRERCTCSSTTATGSRRQVVGWDPYDDVGVLRVSPSAHKLVPVPLGSSAGVRVGQPVAAIGTPFGASTSLSVGVVSGTAGRSRRSTTAYDLFDAIQTDAPINDGNSGGPLLDAAGDAIGINAQIRSSLESGFEGVAFAVPIDSAKRSLDPAARLGPRRLRLPRAADRGSDAGDREGVRVHGPARRDRRLAWRRTARPRSPGLRPGHRTVLWQDQRLTLGGDAIVAIDGLPVRARTTSRGSSPSAWSRASRRGSPWCANGRTRVIPVTLGARP